MPSIDTCTKLHFCGINGFWVMIVYIKNTHRQMDGKIFTLHSCKICLSRLEGDHWVQGHPISKICIFDPKLEALYQNQVYNVFLQNLNIL